MLENRPIVAVTIGYILGIIVGLYCKSSIAVLYIFIFLIYVILKKPHIKKFKLISFRRYFRYVKIIFTKKVCFIIIFISIISNSITLFYNYKFTNLYSDLDNQNIEVIAKVVSNAKEKQYKKVYKIKIISINGNSKYKNTYLYLDVKDEKSFNYGDEIKITGEFSLPQTRTNYKGFDYKEYLKTLKIYGTVKLEKISSQKELKGFSIFKIANDIFLKIKNLIEANFNEDVANILLGITLGYTDNIDEEIKLNFQESNISHVLAVSGMHIGYIVIFLKISLGKLFGKRTQKIMSIFVLIFYMFITGFSTSVVRAVIMSILSIMASLIYGKSDIWQNICLSLLVLLIYNPFLIESASMWLTFVGTIGILTISVLVFIAPIMAIFFNTVAGSNIIVGIIVAVFIGPIIAGCFIFVIFYNLLDLFKLKNLVIKILSLIVNFVIKITKIGSILPMNKFYVTTPNILEIILYYMIVLALWFLYIVYKAKKPTTFQKRVKNLFEVFKYRFSQKKKKIISVILICILIFSIIKIYPKNLKIYFVDVGQGDSCLIVTPRGKNILLDGGGSELRKL